MLNRIRGWMARKAAATTSRMYWLGLGAPTWTPGRYDKISREGYQRNVYVRAAIDEVAGAISGIPLVLYQQEAAGALTEIEAPRHELKQLLKRPNPWMSGAEFRKTMVSHYLLAGNAYILGVKAGGKVRELYTLQPSHVEPKESPRPWEPVGWYEYQPPTKQGRRFNPEEILHLKTFNPFTQMVGMAPIEAAARSVDHSNAAKAWNVALLQNGARPPGAFKLGSKPTDRQLKDYREQFDELYSGATNAGRPMFLWGEMDWKEMGMNAKDMDWISGQKLSAKEISIAFGVPPEMIGDSENKTYSNYQEARKAFYMETVLPLLDMILEELNNWLVPAFGENLFIGYDADRIEALQEDQNQKWDRVTKARQAGVITANEARHEIGFEEYQTDEETDPADMLFQQASLVPYSDLIPGKEPEPPPPDIEPDDPKEDKPEEDGGEGDPKGDSPPEDDPDDVKKKSVFNLNTDERKTAYWKQFDRKREQMVPRVRRQVARRFDEERKAVKAEWIEKQSIPAVLNRLLDLEPKWEKLLRSIYLSVGAEFGKWTLEGLKSQAQAVGLEVKEDDWPWWLWPVVAEGAAGTWEQIVTGWLLTEGGKKVKGITETTLKELQKELATGLNNGESIAEIAKRIDQLYLAQIIPNRSTVIARTEIIGASNLGSRAAAKETGLQLEKEWIATPDKRTRKAHKAANGQTRDFDEPYIVWGDRLQFPGDTSHGAKLRNVIQCRCVEGYHVKGG